MPTRSGGKNFLDTNGRHQLAVTLEDAAGDAVSIGAAYTEGDTDATLAVTVMGFEADTGTNTVRAVSQTYPLPVQQAALAASVDQVSLGAATSGGLSSHSAISTAAVYTAAVKATAGQVYEVDIFNNGANEVFARLYNMATAPGSGDAASIIWRGIVPGSATGTGFIKTSLLGRECATGIGIRVTGAVADNDTTVLAANEVLINVGYK